MLRAALLLLTASLTVSCAGTQAGTVEGRELDRRRPVLVMAVPDYVMVDGREADRSGSVMTAAVRQAFTEFGFEALTTKAPTLDLAMEEAEQLGCGMVAEAAVTDWNESHRDWKANPDRLAMTLRIYSVDDGATVGWGEMEVEDETLNTARNPVHKLAMGLASELLLTIVQNPIAPDDVPGS